jgi:hypothetical protein
MKLYDASWRAFDPATPVDEALRAFQTIYSDLKADWQVFRNASGPCWPAEKTFATIKDAFSGFAWREPVTLKNFHNAGDHASLLSGLVKMRDLKPVAAYRSWRFRNSSTSATRLSSRSTTTWSSGMVS